MDELKGRLATSQLLGGREQQEDDYGIWVNDQEEKAGGEQTLLILCDGMGGAAAGDVASQLAVSSFIESYQENSDRGLSKLKKALTAANDALANVVKKDSVKKGMGCTLIAAEITKDGLFWVSVGDSLLYVFRDGELYRLNADHSLAPMLEKLVANGEMTAEEAKQDPQRHILRSAVTGDEIALMDAQGPLALHKNDIIILASDGIETLLPTQIANIVRQHGKTSMREGVDALLQAVGKENHPRQDNTTIMLFRPKEAWGDEVTTQTLPAPLPTSGDKSGTPRRWFNLSKQKAKIILFFGIAALMGIGVAAVLFWANFNNWGS